MRRFYPFSVPQLTILGFLALLMAAAGTASALPWRGAWKDLDGAAITATQPGDKHLMVFWGTWCVECRGKLKTQLPALMNRRSFGVWTVNVDKDVGRAREFVKREGISVPILRDSEKRMQTELKIFSVPQWVVFRHSGKGDERSDWEVVASGSGFDEAEVERALAKGG